MKQWWFWHRHGPHKGLGKHWGIVVAQSPTSDSMLVFPGCLAALGLGSTAVWLLGNGSSAGFLYIILSIWLLLELQLFKHIDKYCQTYRIIMIYMLTPWEQFLSINGSYFSLWNICFPLKTVMSSVLYICCDASKWLLGHGTQISIKYFLQLQVCHVLFHQAIKRSVNLEIVRSSFCMVLIAKLNVTSVFQNYKKKITLPPKPVSLLHSYYWETEKIHLIVAH